MFRASLNKLQLQRQKLASSLGYGSGFGTMNESPVDTYTLATSGYCPQFDAPQRYRRKTPITEQNKKVQRLLLATARQQCGIPETR